MEYAIVREVPYGVDETIERVTATLAKEGFGILSRIDVHAKMKEKLGKDMPPYVILGACKPPVAWEVIHHDRNVGVLLPCNVVVDGAGGRTTLRAMDPAAALQLLEDPEIEAHAQEIRAAIDRAIQSA